MEIKIVDPTEFKNCMSLHWRDMGNYTNKALRLSWQEFARTLNRRMSQQFNDQWDVLGMPTGSGKTQALALYCGMLRLAYHPGVLIVTPLKEQADSICRLINTHARMEVAVAYHTDSNYSLAQAHQAPVLAITHSAYLTGLRSSGKHAEAHQKFRSLTSWAGGERLLRVIDEAIDMHHTSKVTLQDLSVLSGAIRSLAGPENRKTLECLDQLCAAILDWVQSGTNQERYLSELELSILLQLGLDRLSKELDNISDSELMFSPDGEGISGSAMKRQCRSTLRELQSIIRVGGPWLTKHGRIATLSSSENVFKLEERAGVILDATARIDVRYELLGKKVQVTAPQPGIRDYSNVKLWVVPDQRVGKGYMADKGWELWKPLSERIAHKLGAQREVLVCCHKDAQARIEAMSTPFRRTAYAHWGAITGKNDWNDYDTVVVAGLNYLDRSASAEAYIGLTEATTNDWLQSSAYRRFGSHADIRQSYNLSHLAVSLVQAVNRVRCRRTIDANGKCDETDIVLLVPKGTDGVMLVDMVRSEMPGLQVIQWPIQLQTRKERGAPSKEQILTFLRDAPDGIHTNKEVRAKLGVSRSTYDRVIADFTSEKSAEAQQLRLQGIRYVSQRGGHGRSGFVKEATVIL